jgi:type I restriction-modification system DNA methylase subunit
LSGKPRGTDAATLALWAMIDTTADPEAIARSELRAKMETIQFAKIPGYFPTPEAVRQMMIERARLDDQSLAILEPSAGSGAIADDLRARGFTVDCIEHWHCLREILTAKGHRLIHDDFMSFDGGQYDRILMNPPFEKGQDRLHVCHAFNQLRSGGRLVAIMGAGVMFRADYQAFRDHIDKHGGELVELGAGMFKESGTGVATVMLIIDRD